MPNSVTPFFSILALCGGESRHPENASARVWYPADTFSTASVAGKPDAFRRFASGALTSWSSLFWLAIACDCCSASFVSSGSITTPPKPLFCRYSEIIDAAAWESSLAPGLAMLAYMLGCSTGATSAAQPPSANSPRIATAARMIRSSPTVRVVVAYQPWLNGERRSRQHDSSLSRLRGRVPRIARRGGGLPADPHSERTPAPTPPA